MTEIVIYKATWSDQDGLCVSFHADTDKAKAAFETAKRNGPYVQQDSLCVYPLYVMPTKPSILQLLKYHAPERDNG